MSSGRIPIFSQLWEKMVMLSLPRKDLFSTTHDISKTPTCIFVVFSNRNSRKIGLYDIAENLH